MRSMTRFLQEQTCLEVVQILKIAHAPLRYLHLHITMILGKKRSSKRSMSRMYVTLPAYCTPYQTPVI